MNKRLSNGVVLAVTLGAAGGRVVKLFKDRDGRWGVIWGSHNKKVILQLLFKLHEYTFEDFKLNMKPF